MMHSSWDRQNFLSFCAIFCHFTPLTTQKIQILQKSIFCIFLRCGEKYTEIGNFKSFFAFLPTKNPKIQNFEKWKCLLEMCTNNHNIMHGSWDTEWYKQNFLSFWAIFENPLKTQKIKILKLKETTGDIIILHIKT